MSEHKPTLPEPIKNDIKADASTHNSVENIQPNPDLKARAEQDLNKLRNIINAQALNDQNQLRKAQAQEYVSEVITEALSNRQLKDNSISKMLVPIVEQSIQQSIANHRQQFVDYLYPLVGSLVRNFATSFMKDFIEKTNELIENSVSLKSLNWRYKAWRSGVTFSKFVASQTYVYNIQQVLLIHRETGLLLNSVSADAFVDDNSDIVSSMLTAINDFVNDSFQKQNETEHANHNLDEIKTEDFTLYLKRGPQALLVASVSGNISPKAKDKLQTTLEYIHSNFLPQLREFDGDNSHFLNASDELDKCLLSEQINEDNTKKPWLAIVLFSLLFALFSYWLYLKWETNHALQALSDLPSSQGIVLASAQVTGLNKIETTLFRDPAAVSIKEWLSNANLNSEWLTIKEQAFVSLDSDVLARKIQQLVNGYDGLAYSLEQNTVNGQLSSAQMLLFKDALQKIPGVATHSPRLDIQAIPTTLIENSATQQAMTIMAGEISQLQIDFGLASSEINQSEQAKLRLLVSKLNLLKDYAASQNLKVKLLILGTSDNIGSQEINRRLSIERAKNVSLALQEIGLKKEDLMTSGLGIVEDASPGTNIRKAIVNVVYNSINQ